jgi:hypothetical protein
MSTEVRTDARGPVILAGPDRSGTTLLYAIVGSHPRIAMVRRTNEWRFFYRRYGDLSDPANLDRILADLATYKRVAKLEPDIDRLRRDFEAEGPATYGRLFSLLHEQLAAREGKPRWGEKSLHTEHHTDDLFAEMPDARVVHMLRDPRDRYASVMKRHGRDVHRVAAATGRWIRSTDAGLRNRRRWPDRYRIVRYEDLVREPEPTVREVCAFLGEDYDPVMLQMEAEPEHRDTGGNSSFGDVKPGEISTVAIGRFRDRCTPMEIRFIEAMAGRRMRRVGYPLAKPSLAGTRLRYYGGFLPANAARMAAWMTLAWARGRRAVPAHGMTKDDAAEVDDGG